MKTMNHIKYSKKVTKLSSDSLRFIIRDCKRAMEAMPDNPNNSYYADEICYCVNELAKRNK